MYFKEGFHNHGEFIKEILIEDLEKTQNNTKLNDNNTTIQLDIWAEMTEAQMADSKFKRTLIAATIF